MDETDKDDKYDWADANVTDEQTLSFLDGMSILLTYNLLELANKIGIEELYDEDGWVDDVADYILEHADSCQDLWDHIRKNYK